ncbi:hypothetical protein [Paenibacillus sp. MMO-58]
MTRPLGASLGDYCPSRRRMAAWSSALQQQA